MNFNPADLLNPTFRAVDTLLEDDGVCFYQGFVWLALALISRIFGSGLRKRLKGNSAMVIPVVIITMQPPGQSPPPATEIEVEPTRNHDDETTD